MSHRIREALGDTHEQYDTLLTHLSIIRDLVRLAHHAGSFAEICASVAERLVAGLGFERVTVVVGREPDPLEVAGSFSQGERLAGDDARGPAVLLTLARDVMTERGLLRWNGEGVGARRALPRDLEGSLVGFPLVVGDECLGAVLCEEIVAATWDLARQRALELVGEIISQVVTLVQVRLSLTDMQHQLESELGVSLSRLTHQEQTLRAQSDRIAQLTHSLVASNQAKNNFLGLMSHELRTPLSVILGFGSILHDGLAGPVTHEQEQHLDRVLSNGRHLNQLVDDMLFFVDAETTRIEPKCGAVDLPQLVREVVDALPETSRENAPAFTLAIAPEAARMETDPALLRRVLFHLIGNAFKFTERGTVRIEATRRAAGAVTEIRIIDTGVGIPPEKVDHIFELFQPGDDTHTRRHEGVGLGLNLVRACLVLLHGRCRLVAGPDGGTQAEVLIPDAGARLAEPAGAGPPLDAEVRLAAAGGADLAREGVSRAGGSSSPSGRTGSGRG